MNEFQFFPSTPALAARMWKKFENLLFRRVIDPHGGEGDLILGFPEDLQHRLYGVPMDVCEIDFSKHPTLRAKRVNIVGMDFLELQDAAAYSHFLMNPPFKEAEHHVLHAFKVLYDGEIVAQVNAETIRNPYTAARRQLVALIEQHGSVEFVEDAYSGADARVKAKVDVAIVYLRKRADESELLAGLLDDLYVDGNDDEKLAEGFGTFNELALPKTTIETAVALFNSAVRAMRESVRAEARAQYTADLIGQTMTVLNGDMSNQKGDYSVSFVQTQMGKRYMDLKDRAWAQLLRSSRVTEKLSSKAQKRVESEFEQICKLDFTVKNIYGFLQGVLDSQGQIQIEMALDIFDEVTRYVSDNTAYYRGYGSGQGWKSNDKHRLCGRRIKHTRFILPGFAKSYSNDVYYESYRRLEDFDKVFAMLDGKVTPDVSLVSVFKQHSRDLAHGERVSSSYFDVRWYPGIGTVHFFPRSQEVVDRLNRLVGRHRAWLPPEDSMANKDFWHQYDKAEKLSKELEQSLRKQPLRSYGRSLFHDLDSRDDECRIRAEARIDAAMKVVHDKHGLDIETMIENKEAAPQQLLLAA